MDRCPACHRSPAVHQIARMSGVIAVVIVQVQCDCGFTSEAADGQQVGLPLCPDLIRSVEQRALNNWEAAVELCAQRRAEQ